MAYEVEGEGEVKNWLQQINLSEYAKAFIDEGYDDLEQISDMKDEDITDLIEDVGLSKKNGHKKRFIAAVAILKSKKNHGLAQECKPKSPDDECLRNIMSGTIVKLPCFLEELVIPNPFSEKLKYYNSCLYEMFQALDGTLAPFQLKDYIISQRQLRWKLTEQVNNLSQNYKTLFEDGASGQSSNVLKYSKPIVEGYLAKDVHRCKNTLTDICNFLKKIDNLLEHVTTLRNQLFGPDMSVKLWRAHELRFYDQMKEDLSIKKGKVESVLDRVSHTHKTLRRRFNSQAADDPEQKRKAKRKRDNKAKSKRNAEKRFVASCRTLLVKLTGKKSDEFLKNGKELDSTKKIKMNDITPDFETKTLCPRFHLQPLKFLIEKDAFDFDAREWVVGVKRKLEIKAQNMCEKLKNVKKRKVEATSSKTMTLDSFVRRDKAD